MNSNQPNLKKMVLEVVKLIPESKITYFGQIAGRIGSDARTVGWILSGMTEAEMQVYPWYRVVAKNGYISSLKMGYKGQLQKEILQKEGYTLIGDFVDMQKHGLDQEVLLE